MADSGVFTAFSIKPTTIKRRTCAVAPSVNLSCGVGTIVRGGFVRVKREEKGIAPKASPMISSVPDNSFSYRMVIGLHFQIDEDRMYFVLSLYNIVNIIYVRACDYVRVCCYV